ncbi:MAG TPA: PLP-dependent transferase [Streptosporangiaceae bacterium]|nr:PLP-dependent transferase [Streptosporangiaceae bacterium]
MTDHHGPRAAEGASPSAEATLVHAGRRRGLGEAVVQPPVLSTILGSAGEPGAADYARAGNPTWAALEEALGSLEGATAVVFSSGQAASMALMLSLTSGRDKLLLPSDGYYNARVLAERLRPHGAAPVFVDQSDLPGIEHELRSGGAAVLWAESPTNPLLRVADLTRLGQLAAAAGAPMVVDNTVATGLLQRPLDMGAVASLCSLTKSASGHSDVIAGAVMTRDAELAAELRLWRTLGGGILGPMEAWLAVRGLTTLPLRIERQSASAQAVAEHLAAHPKVTAVHYPGVHAATLALARAQMPLGFGPLLSFEVAGPPGAADAVVAAARLIVPATSFGGVDSSWERRGRWAGETASSSLIRLSVGLEPAADLITDINKALAAVPPAG